MLKINKNRLFILLTGKTRRLFLLCGRRDSNPHAVRHQILSLARLPIPPRPLNAVQMYVIYFTHTIRQSNLFELFLPYGKVLSQFEILPQVNTANFLIRCQFFSSSGFHNGTFVQKIRPVSNRKGFVNIVVSN